jgi:DhnA family fructose-bisphosphate aldolase class Ia
MTSERRLDRIFGDDGRTVILALDAPYFATNINGVDAAVAAVPRMRAHGLDAVLVPKGIAMHQHKSLGDVALVLRCDAVTDVYEGSVPGSFMVNTALDAVQVGADGVVVMAFPGSPDHVRQQIETQKLNAACVTYQMPLIVEALPFRFKPTEAQHSDPANVATAVRMAAELGADVVKTRYSGQPGDELIAASSPVPVVALGGPKADLEGYLAFVKHCIDTGAAGVAVGRNIVEDPYPVAKVAALAAIVHNDATAAEAVAIYNDTAHE